MSTERLRSESGYGAGVEIVARGVGVGSAGQGIGRLLGFVAVLLGYTARAAWRSRKERRLLLSGLVCALAVYLISSAAEWHWYIPPSTMFFFILAGIAMKFASREDWGAAGADAPPASSGPPRP